MFSFVDLRLALLLGAAVLLVRAQGEDDRKSHHCLLELLEPYFFFFFPPPLTMDVFPLRGGTAAGVLDRGEEKGKN